MSDWLYRLAHAPDGIAALTAVGALAALWTGYSGLRRARHIEDVPTARVRSAPQGYVELTGTAHAMEGEPIIAPLSNTVCCWYRYRVEHRDGSRWDLVESGSSDGIFLLRDETGECVVDPEGAEVTSSHTRSWASDGSGFGGLPVHARLPSLGRTADLVVGVGGKVLEALGGAGQYRYTEAVILDGDPLYAIGEFHSLSAGDQAASIRDMTGAILREWKRQPETLRERFDLDRDGAIDPEEWDRARAAAEREASAEYAASLQRAHVHTLRRPADRRYFLLSNLEEFSLLRRYRWRKRLGLGIFVLLAAAFAMMLSTRI
ncbi:MAG: hypothetical protein KDI88_08200 [Gammaproteobacteria bacterium]|nr:hypothetical protein [Gammaproteobacteria bacterium]